MHGGNNLVKNVLEPEKLYHLDVNTGPAEWYMDDERNEEKNGDEDEANYMDNQDIDRNMKTRKMTRSMRLRAQVTKWLWDTV